MKTLSTRPTVSDQIIAFADLIGYHRHICARRTPEEGFEFLTEYYSIVQRVCEGSDARIVKFMGDSILILFRAESPDAALDALREMKAEIDSWLVRSGHDSRLRIKAHVGEVAIGSLGGAEFDVCGLAVNETALLPDREWVLSDVLRKRTNA